MRIRNATKQWYWRLKHKAVPAYIHIPKTGGTYLVQMESDKKPVIYPAKYLGHTCIISDEKNRVRAYPPTVGFLPHYVTPLAQISSYFVFSTVRNIFDWLVSYYFHAGGFNPQYRDENHYDYYTAQKGFDYLIRTIADRDRNTWPNRQFIHFQLFADNGGLVADWVNRTSSLDQDLEAMADELNIGFNKRPKQRVARDDDYRTYYSDGLAELVSSVWGRELKLFGFAFGAENGSAALIGRRVNEETKQRIQYFWKEDKLLVDGEVW